MDLISSPTKTHHVKRESLLLTFSFLLCLLCLAEGRHPIKADTVLLDSSLVSVDQPGIRGGLIGRKSYSNVSRHLQDFGSLQDPDCPRFSDNVALFQPDDVNDAFGEWLVDDSDSSFLYKMIEDYVNDQMVGAKGKNIRDLDGDFSETCNRLPLDDETCYFVSNPEESFLDNLVAKYIPFFRPIIEAKNFISDLLDEVSDSAEDIYNFVLADREARGSCIAINQDMIGIVDVPGIPPPWVYQVCNCLSIKSGNPPACTIQPYFRGFAFASGNNALAYDISDRLGQDFFFYDGFAQYKFVPRGDIWANLDLRIGIPKLFGGIGLDNAFCLPSDAPPGTTLKYPQMPNFKMKTSLLIQNDINVVPNGELFILAAIEEMDLVVAKFFDLRLGSALAALRIRSANPDCQPSGLFVSTQLTTDFALGEGLRQFVGAILPDATVEVNFGVTWKDTDEPEPQDYLQSLFYRFRLSDFQFMGFAINVDQVELEIQYFDDLEFSRRREWTADKCCVGDVTDCSIPNQPLLDFINNADVEEKPTVGMFLSVQDLSFFEVIKFESVQLNIIFQLAFDGSGSASFLLDADVTVLFIAKVEIRVAFLVTPAGATAEFSASTELNVGVGKLRVALKATAAVDNYLYPDQPDGNRLLAEKAPRSLLETSGGGSLLDADWDLAFTTDWQTAQWLQDLGAAIVEGLKKIAEAIIFVWNKITEFVENAWNAIKEFAAEIGEAIADVFDAIGEAVDIAQDTLADAVDQAVAFLKGQGPIGEFGGKVVAFLGDVADVVLDKVGQIADLASAVARGDWSAAGKAVRDFFGFSKSISKKREIKTPIRDEIFDCPQNLLMWEECDRVFGIKTSCRTITSELYPDRSCAEPKLKKINKLKQDAEFAQQQNQCNDESKKRNQGLQYVNDQDEENLQNDLDVQMETTESSIGKTSSLDGCKPLPFRVGIGKLSEETSGLSGRDQKDGLSSQCVDYSNAESLGKSLEEVQKDVASEAADLSRGNQGLDRDFAVGKCAELAGAACTMEPYLEEKSGFKINATITCDIDWNTFNFEEIFGRTDVIQDSGCSAKPVEFVVLGTFDDNEDGCAPVEMRIERTAVDCCDQTVRNPITHTLFIESLPPTFTQTPGSMDMELPCDENIHPARTGKPTYNPGCEASVEDLDFVDEHSDLDILTCTTTVTRKFVVMDNDCDALTDNFVQTFILRNDYAPTWDYFPPDATVGIFDAYGTDKLGYPTVYQQCGASPIKITYTDRIAEGDCFAERVLSRTFRAEDVCGHVTERTQTIKITNSADSLPLGDKSLASLYGRDKARIGMHDDRCLWSFNRCGISGAPMDYQCKKAPEDEFMGYQAFLWDLNMESLDLGPTEMTCNCESGDISCDAIQQATVDDEYIATILYGVQVVNGAGTCATVTSMPEGTNTGSSASNKVTCPVIHQGKKDTATCGQGKKGETVCGSDGNKSGKKSQTVCGAQAVNQWVQGKKDAEHSVCKERVLQGSDQVYNFFQIPVEDVASKKIVIDAPPSSIVLVNVESAPGQCVTINPLTSGVELVGSLSEHHVLWNIPHGVNIYTEPSERVPYSFYGTMLNSLGEMHLSFSQQTIWKGQLFSDFLCSSDCVHFKCGHFAGFTSCS